MFPNLSATARTVVFAVLLAVALPASPSTLDPKLQTALRTANASDILSVVVTYNNQPAALDIAALRGLGIKYGVVLQQLPMVGVWANPAQINQIAAKPSVRSIYLNAPLKFFNKEGTAIIGAVRQRTMPGFGYSGRGVGVAIVDSGIDATHPDLPLGSHVRQNVKVAIGGASLGSPFTDILPPTYAENMPDTDLTSGHGTHCAGIVGGLGTESGGIYAGVAPGADLIGVSTGETIAILWALEGWDYVLTHHYLYNIRVVSNSWGTSGPFNPEDPINVASKALHDNGITVCFASGNDGPGANSLNPYSVAPWVIGVAAGDKQGKLADFSSRGIKDDPFYHPNITAPGVSIISCRAKGSVLGAISGDATDDPNLPPSALPYYAHLSGTSMATPSVAGCCALLLEANGTLTPDRVKSTLMATATRMAGYETFQVGAGYANVLAALDLAKNAAKPYGAVLNQTFNAKLNGFQSSESWAQDWDPVAAPPRHDFTVGLNAMESDVFITWDNFANSFNLAVTDPAGNVASTGSNLLAAVYGDSASLSFSAPVSGHWFTTVYGLKGQSTGTTGIGVTDTIHGTILGYYGTFSGLNDIGSSPYASYIRRAVSLRLMDSDSIGAFRPAAATTRGVAAKVIASDCEVRQNLFSSMPFTDVTGELAPYVRAVTSPGAPIRDVFLAAGPIMTGTSSTGFSPNSAFVRAELAVWLVRALGLEAQAKANAAAATTFTDDRQIPTWARGYVVVADQIGLMPGFANTNPVPGTPATFSWRPLATVPRGEMAVTILRWYDIFHQ